MKQPELGNTVAKLRQNKGITQEELALRCGIKPEVVFKIENGLVSPNAKILKLLSEELDHEFTFDSSNDSKFWLVTLHLSNFFCVVVIPLAIWYRKRNDDREIELQGKDVINFQISMIIYFMASTILVFVWIGMIFLLILGWYLTIITIINTVKVVNGNNYKYPLSIKFIK